MWVSLGRTGWGIVEVLADSLSLSWHVPCTCTCYRLSLTCMCMCRACMYNVQCIIVTSSPGHSQFFNIARWKHWEWPGDKASVMVDRSRSCFFLIRVLVHCELSRDRSRFYYQIILLLCSYMHAQGKRLYIVHLINHWYNMYCMQVWSQVYHVHWYNIYMYLYLYHVLVSYGTVGLLSYMYMYVDEGSFLGYLTCTLALMDDKHNYVDCTLTCMGLILCIYSVAYQLTVLGSKLWS